ncbi:hypothetical protein GCM10023238_11370 [Streptomyces heliomycini]
MGGRGGQDQGVRAGRQGARQLVAQRTAVDQVVRLVDDDRVPADLLQVVLVLVGVLEGVDGDDDPLEGGERVAAGRDLPLDPLDAHRVQPHQRDREPRPQLVLELLQHMLRRDHQDALAPAAADQLGQGQADLQGLAETHHVRDQQSRAQIGAGQSQLGGAPLVGQRVHQERVGERQAAFRLGQGGAAQHRLQEQPGAAVVRGVVQDEPGRARVEQFDAVQAGEEHGLLVADELRHPRDLDARTVVGRRHRTPDQPLLVPHDHQGAGRVLVLAARGTGLF